jgi:hypothetical protein
MGHNARRRQGRWQSVHQVHRLAQIHASRQRTGSSTLQVNDDHHVRILSAGGLGKDYCPRCGENLEIHRECAPAHVCSFIDD